MVFSRGFFSSVARATQFDGTRTRVGDRRLCAPRDSVSRARALGARRGSGEPPWTRDGRGARSRRGMHRRTMDRPEVSRGFSKAKGVAFSAKGRRFRKNLIFLARAVGRWRRSPSGAMQRSGFSFKSCQGGGITSFASVEHRRNAQRSHPTSALLRRYLSPALPCEHVYIKGMYTHARAHVSDASSSDGASGRPCDPGAAAPDGHLPFLQGVSSALFRRASGGVRGVPRDHAGCAGVSATTFIDAQEPSPRLLLLDALSDRVRVSFRHGRHVFPERIRRLG